MCRLGITIAPRGEMIMKSKMTVNCRNPRMPITTFSYRENLIRTGARVAGLSMRFLLHTTPSEEIDIGAVDQLLWLNPETLHKRVSFAKTSTRVFVLGQHHLEFKKLP